MNPAYSVIFLTTLIGVGQGLFIALFMAQIYSNTGNMATLSSQFYAIGSVVALLFLGAGLFASFFHLGHPERAWRAATQWRTSWLSREVIALPIFMLSVLLYGAFHYFENPVELSNGLSTDVTLIAASSTVTIGIFATIACLALFICTGMIYACLKFLQEWNCALTPINYTLIGLSSGFVLVTALASFFQAHAVDFFSNWAIMLTGAAFIFRGASLIRNHRIKYKSTTRSAIGVRHTKIQQKAQGAMGGSFNTREFFHGKTALFLKSIKWIFLLMAFALPALFLAIGSVTKDPNLFIAAFIVQYIGLIAERWFFFAQARHPQNIYYQTI